MRFPSYSGDAFSPMLIKELRQGLKSKSFYFAFLLMQGLMFFSVLMLVGAVESGTSREGANITFWICLGAPLVIITPLRALGGLAQEIKGNTLELIFLTRLTAWRIVAGKWLSLFSQSLLLSMATLPYLFLRYFIGGINVSDDLLMMFWLLLGSALLTATGVGFSAFRAVWVRVLVVIGFFIGIQFLLGLSMAMRFGGGGGGPFAGHTHPMLFALAVALTICITTALMLFWGAGRIAPAAENYSRWKRLLTLALLGCVGAMAWASGEEGVLFISLVVIVPLCVDVLGEKPLLFPSVYEPFAKRGGIGRLVSVFFAPGWPSGVFFTLLCSGVFIGMVHLSDMREPEGLHLAYTLPGALLFPPAVVLLVRPKAQNLLGGILGVFTACFIIAIIAWIIHENYRKFDPSFLNFIPTCACVMSASSASKDLSWIWVTTITSGLSFVVLLVRMRPVVAEILKNYKTAIANVAARRAPATENPKP